MRPRRRRGGLGGGFWRASFPTGFRFFLLFCLLWLFGWRVLNEKFQGLVCVSMAICSWGLGLGLGLVCLGFDRRNRFLLIWTGVDWIGINRIELVFIYTYLNPRNTCTYLTCVRACVRACVPLGSLTYTPHPIHRSLIDIVVSVINNLPSSSAHNILVLSHPLPTTARSRSSRPSALLYPTLAETTTRGTWSEVVLEGLKITHLPTGPWVMWL